MTVENMIPCMHKGNFGYCVSSTLKIQIVFSLFSLFFHFMFKPIYVRYIRKDESRSTLIFPGYIDAEGI